MGTTIGAFVGKEDSKVGNMLGVVGLLVGETLTVDKSRLLVTACIAEAPLAFAKLTKVVVKLPLEIVELNAFVNAENVVSVLLKPQLAALATETL